jgi:hypothetical protein
MTPAEINARAQRQRETIERVAQRLRAKAAEIVKRFEGRSFTAAEAYPEIDDAWKKATEMHKVAHTLSNISKEHLKQADYNVIHLLELRAQLTREAKFPARYQPGGEVWRKARDYQTALILWLIEVQRPVPPSKILFSPLRWTKEPTEHAHELVVTLSAGDWENGQQVRPFLVKLKWGTWSASRRKATLREVRRAWKWFKENSKSGQKAWLFFLADQRPEEPNVFEIADWRLVCALTGKDAEWRHGPVPSSTPATSATKPSAPTVASPGALRRV